MQILPTGSTREIQNTRYEIRDTQHYSKGSHGDFLKFHPTFILIFRILYNKVCISYIVYRMSYGEWYILPSTHLACGSAREGLAYFLCTFVSSWLCGYKSIMQNKANLPGVEINAISLFTKDYENFMLHESQKNKAKTKPIAGLWPEIRSTNHEIRNELKELFEKTNPIFERVK